MRFNPRDDQASSDFFARWARLSGLRFTIGIPAGGVVGGYQPSTRCCPSPTAPEGGGEGERERLLPSYRKLLSLPAVWPDVATIRALQAARPAGIPSRSRLPERKQKREGVNLDLVDFLWSRPKPGEQFCYPRIIVATGRYPPPPRAVGQSEAQSTISSVAPHFFGPAYKHAAPGRNCGEVTGCRRPPGATNLALAGAR
jgi:hypothetical protein